MSSVPEKNKKLDFTKDEKILKKLLTTMDDDDGRPAMTF